MVERRFSLISICIRMSKLDRRSGVEGLRIDERRRVVSSETRTKCQALMKFSRCDRLTSPLRIFTFMKLLTSSKALEKSEKHYQNDGNHPNDKIDFIG